MREAPETQALCHLGTPCGWFIWAKRHPRVMLLGALALAILACRTARRANGVQTGTAGEDVPLFI